MTRDWVSKELESGTGYYEIARTFREAVVNLAVMKCAGNKSKAARLLKVHPNNLYNWLKEERPENRTEAV